MNRLFLIIAMGLAMVACKDKPRDFNVKVEAPGIGTQQVTVVYTTDDGNRRSISLPSVNGQFEFSGSSSSPSIIEIFTSSKQLYTAVIAQNGESLVLRAIDGGFQVDGSERSNVLANYKPGTDTVGMSAEVRRAIDVVYTEHSRDNMPTFISPEVIIGRDSVTTFEAEGVWVFTSSLNERTKSVLDTLRARADVTKNVRDIFVSTDTVSWRVYTRRDSATWTQAMLPDGPLKLQGILTSTPLLVEVDSLGVVKRTQRLE